MHAFVASCQSNTRRFMPGAVPRCATRIFSRTCLGKWSAGAIQASHLQPGATRPRKYVGETDT